MTIPRAATTLSLAAAIAISACTDAPDVLTPEDAARADHVHTLALDGPSGIRGGADLNQALAAIRRGTAQYQRLEAAAPDYVLASGCVSAGPLGGMGFHYLNEGLMDGVVDPAAPELLLYEPMKNGGMRLVGVEFMVPAGAWTGSEPPMLAGVEFDSHLTPETQHGLPFPHYDLHVWTWKHNPSGMFTGFNPDVSCQFAP